jgi:hypothetical protein
MAIGFSQAESRECEFNIASLVSNAPGIKNTFQRVCEFFGPLSQPYRMGIIKNNRKKRNSGDTRVCWDGRSTQFLLAASLPAISEVDYIGAGGDPRSASGANSDAYRNQEGSTVASAACSATLRYPPILSVTDTTLLRLITCRECGEEIRRRGKPERQRCRPRRPI